MTLQTFIPTGNLLFEGAVCLFMYAQLQINKRVDREVSELQEGAYNELKAAYEILKKENAVLRERLK